MRYKIKHVTRYEYADFVSLCQNHARLTPRSDHKQINLNSRIYVEPEPGYIDQYMDYYHNQVTVFELPTQHKTLTVTAESEIQLLEQPDIRSLPDKYSWEDVRHLLRHPECLAEYSIEIQTLQCKASEGQTSENTDSLFSAAEFALPSPFVPIHPEMKQFAELSFTPGRPLIDATYDLMARIFHEFQYDPGFSTISTPILAVLQHKKGVCQDFAHLAIGCLRSLGLAARYVSGYIETLPPEGQEKLEGADATHAWFAVYVPEIGWLDFDPTNNVTAKDQHITVAVGRDFSDVTPLKGVVFGGGSNRLSVAVDVTRL
ncbi:transglutaminase family protein [Oceanospirillum sediminis]|uniref:Transglutaminase family protein n=1 Tax=Oceanospirillum sediminis TaxID=2760088 RepID=A0A839IVU2_9GAMM|nr:transglutaminase family protein [Oceanospirillum sediminis]